MFNKTLFFDRVEHFKLTGRLFELWVGCSQASASRWLREPERIPSDKLVRVAQLLGVPVSALFTYPESAESFRDEGAKIFTRREMRLVLSSNFSDKKLAGLFGVSERDIYDIRIMKHPPSARP